MSGSRESRSISQTSGSGIEPKAAQKLSVLEQNKLTRRSKPGSTLIPRTHRSEPGSSLIRPDWTSNTGKVIADAGRLDSPKDEAQDSDKSVSKKEKDRRRRWLSDEIGLVQSLESQRQGDINEILLDLVVERRAFQTNVRPSDVEPWHSRYRWSESKEERRALPEKEVIAWPLEPHEVPRPDEWFDNSYSSKPLDRATKRRRVLKPSAELEEVLCDLGLQKARKKWEAQNITQGTSMPRSAGKSIDQDDIHSESSEVSSDDEGLLRPVVSADDERSHRIMAPSVRHILADLDSLLKGLHHSRIAHDKANTYEDQIFKDRPKKAAQTKIRRKRSDESDSESEDHPKEEERRGRKGRKDVKISASDRSSRSPPGLRDWSDVLGMAAVMGWKADVVERAARRCSKLFGEGMSFTTFEESKADEAVPVLYTPTVEQRPLTPRTSWTTESMVCPHEDCPRHDGAKFVLKSRLLQHIRAVHKWDPLTDVMPMTMVGGVHIDGFLQPIHAQRGWRGKDKGKRRRSSSQESMLEGELDIGGQIEGDM